MKRISLLFSFLMLCLFLNAQVTDQVESTLPTKTETISGKVAPKTAYHGKMGGRYGFYKGQDWWVPPIYDELSKEYSDFMIAKKGEKYGVIDRLNNVVLPFEYDTFRRPILDWKTKKYANYYFVEKEGLKGICDFKGKYLIPLEYTHLQKVDADYYCFGDKENGYGVLNIDGAIVIAQKYDEPINLFKAGVLKAKKDGKIGFVDFEEKIILPFEWEKMESEYGFYKVQRNGKWGIMTSDLKLVIEPKYDFVKRRFNGIFKVMLGEKWGAINNDFQEIIPLKYASLELFHPRYFAAVLDKNESRDYKGVIDTFGHQILDFEYNKFKRAGEDLIFAKKSREPLYAVFNEKGNQIAPPTFLAVSGLTKKLSYVMLNYSPEGKKAMMDENGKVITPYIYDQINAKRDRNDREKYKITAERDGIVGTLNSDGTEQEGFKSVVNERKQIKEREQQKNVSVLNKLKGEWYGLTKINAQEYLSKINFMSPNGGIRTIYYLEKGKECAVEQFFQPVLLSDQKTLMIQFLSQHIDVKCTNAPSIFNINNMSLFSKEILHLKGGSGNVAISKYSKKETTSTKKETYDLLRKIQRFKPIETDLKNKVEKRPGGIHRPEFNIAPETGIVQIITYGSLHNFGVIELKEDTYIFKPTRWMKTSNFSLAGILKNVRYLDENGKEKVGDLDICLDSTSLLSFFFRETLK